MPQSTELPIQVVQLTDTHLYADCNNELLGLNTDRSLSRVIELVRQQHLPNIVVASGDLAHDGSAAAYQRLDTQFSQLHIPVYCLPGNHDDGTALRKYLNSGLLRTCHKMVTDNGWQMVFVDSTVAGCEGGHITDEALYQLNETLTNSSSQPTIVWLHHQPVPVGSRWLDSMAVDNGQSLLSSLERHSQVQALVWGHVHQVFDDNYKHIRLLATPSTCIQFLPGSDEFTLDRQPPGYRWLKLYRDGTLETGVERLDEIPGEVDPAKGSY